MKYFKHLIVMLLLSSLLFSCTSFKTALYDQYSYQKTVEIKVEASNLMDKATTPYTDHLEEIEMLDIEIKKIVEYEKNKPDNEITYAMWKILADKEKNLLVGFLSQWQEKETLKPAFVQEAKGQIIEAMDLIIEFEATKDKEVKNALLELITA